MIPIADMKMAASAIVWKAAALTSLSWTLPNDELTLKNELTRLESRWSSLDSWLKFWILLVVIGVVVEVVVVLVEHFHARREFLRGTIRTPDRPNISLLVFSLLGGGLVAIGVAGEFGIQLKASKVESDMRNATGSLVAIVNQKAVEAGERASQNEMEAAQLRKDAEAEKKARLADAKKLEGEKQKRLELAASLLPRELRDEVGLVKALSALPPVKVRFEYREEEELVQIAEQIHAVVAASKWKAWRKRGNEWMIREGITVSPGNEALVGNDDHAWKLWMEEEESTRTACEGVVRALGGPPGGLDVWVGNSAYDLPPGTILISIGTKPNHAAEEAIRELSRPLGAQPPAGPRGTRLGIPDSEPAKPISIKLVK